MLCWYHSRVLPRRTMPSPLPPPIQWRHYWPRRCPCPKRPSRHSGTVIVKCKGGSIIDIKSGMSAPFGFRNPKEEETTFHINFTSRKPKALTRKFDKIQISNLYSSSITLYHHHRSGRRRTRPRSRQRMNPLQNSSRKELMCHTVLATAFRMV